MKWLLALLSCLFIASCNPGGSRKLDCNMAGIADLDATWSVHIYKHTLVTWPSSGNWEIREQDFDSTLTVEQCGPRIAVIGMSGDVDAAGAALHLDVTDESPALFGSLKYTATGEGYLGEQFGWFTIKTDYDFVVYDSTFTVIMYGRKYD